MIKDLVLTEDEQRIIDETPDAKIIDLEQKINESIQKQLIGRATGGRPRKYPLKKKKPQERNPNGRTAEIYRSDDYHEDLGKCAG